MLRDYIAKHKTLPGVRDGREPLSWPSAHASRPTPSGSMSNSGDYIAARRALLSRYGIPWLLALHDLDTHIYAKLVYDICLEIAEIHSGNVFDPHLDDTKEKVRGLPESVLFIDIGPQARFAAHCDQVLRSIMKLSQLSIAFTIFDELFVLWLESTSTLNAYEVVSQTTC